MFKTNYWIRSGSYSILQRVTSFLFGFGSYLFLVRYFSVNDFGEWALYLMVCSAVEMSRSAFIQNAFIKFFNEKGADKNNLFANSLLLNFLSTLLFVILLLSLMPILGSFWNSEIITNLILWYCITSLVLVPFTQLNYLEQANHQFAGIFWSTVVRQGLFFLTVFICYWFFKGLSLTFFAAAQCLASGLGLIPAFLFTRKMLPRGFRLDWPMAKKLFKFGKFILGTGITSTIGKSTGQVMLGGINHGMVAIYDASARILNFIEIPAYSVSNVVYPKIAERASREGRPGVRFLYEKSVATIIALILPGILFILIFPELVLTITAGKKYVDAAGPLRIMMLASFLVPFNIQLGSVFEVINKPHVSFYINLISNILSVILNVILIHLLGVMGAVYAFALTVGFIFCIGQWYVNSYISANTFSVLIKIIEFYSDTFFKILKVFNGFRPRNIPD
jgi:lipopolysaccharide exporter